VLLLRISLYRKLAADATVTQARALRTEIKFRSAVKVGDIQVTADRLSREHRELDSLIQAANWNHDLSD